MSPERAITNSVGQTIRTRGSVRSIQELAGHQNLTTTQRYMHLTPATLSATHLTPSVLTALMAYAYGRPNPRDVPEPETPITIELNIPKPPGVSSTNSTG